MKSLFTFLKEAITRDGLSKFLSSKSRNEIMQWVDNEPIEKARFVRFVADSDNIYSMDMNHTHFNIEAIAFGRKTDAKGYPNAIYGYISHDPVSNLWSVILQGDRGATLHSQEYKSWKTYSTLHKISDGKVGSFTLGQFENSKMPNDLEKWNPSNLQLIG